MQGNQKLLFDGTVCTGICAIWGGKYAIIFDNWDVIDNWGRKKLPELCDNIFNGDNTGKVV